MNNRHWELMPVTVDPHYIPDAQEIAEMAEVEREQQECKHKNFNDEDGCLDCGFGAK
jgi:hypothetical protein